jgi:hypothetical protein
MSFELTTQENVTWNLPFGTASPSQASGKYVFQHVQPMSFTILWPSYLMRLISGQFKGTLQWETSNYYVGLGWEAY